MQKLILLSFVSAVGVLAGPETLGQGIMVEADSGVLSPPFIITNRCLCQPLISSLTNGGRAVYTFSVTNAGEYAVLAQVDAPAGSTNALSVNIDAEPEGPAMIWDIPATSGFSQRAVTWRGAGVAGSLPPPARFFALTPGAHRLILRGTEGNLQLRSFHIVPPPAPPQRVRIVRDGQ
jgi:hypothetical protein